MSVAACAREMARNEISKNVSRTILGILGEYRANNYHTPVSFNWSLWNAEVVCYTLRGDASEVIYR